jgi:outer membrane lipoprotein-sorting protein
MNALRRLSLVAAVFLSLPAQHPADAQRPTPPWTLQTLMAALRQVRSSNASFIETKSLRLLNQVQTSSGRLLYVAPNWMQKQTIAPVASRLTIAGDRLTVERQGEPNREISLQDYSQIGALIDSVRATLAGDATELSRHFAPSLTGDANAWTLTLTPTDPKLRDMVASIRILGQQTAIREIDTDEADGDRTTMAITPEPR